MSKMKWLEMASQPVSIIIGWHRWHGGSGYLGGIYNVCALAIWLAGVAA
jgi:hypothetical protein